MRILFFNLFIISTLFAKPLDVWENYGKKINYQCGTQFKIEWDEESLKKHVKTINYGQVSGERQCNEPLRYMYYACQDEGHKKKIQNKKITKILCKGTAENVGKLSFKNGVLTVEHANEESKPFLRSLKEFSQAIGISELKLGNADPYYDEKWSDLKHEKNPVTDFRNYCVVNSEKFELDPESPRAYQHFDPIIRRKESGVVKCWRYGKVFVDLNIEAGKQSGFVTQNSSPPFIEENYLKGERHGLTRNYDRENKLKSIINYIQGKQEWKKEFYSDGKLETYDRNFNPLGYQYATARIRYDREGKLNIVQCHPKAGSDIEFQKLCGFKGKSVVKTYNGRGEAKETIFLNGEEQKKVEQLAGGKTKTQTFKNQKKDGVETVKKSDGNLLYTISWKNGKMHGPAKYYDEKENKLIKEEQYENDALKSRIEYFLNGNKKTISKYESYNKKHLVEFYDLGGKRSEGKYDWISRRWWSYWEPQGTVISYYETGEKYGELVYKNGEKVGIQTYYHKNGTPLYIENFDNEGQLTMIKIFDDLGKLKLHEEYEKDGSRKIIFSQKVEV